MFRLSTTHVVAMAHIYMVLTITIAAIPSSHTVPISGFEIAPGGTNIISISDSSHFVNVRYDNGTGQKLTGKLDNNTLLDSKYITLNIGQRTGSVEVNPTVLGKNFGIHELEIELRNGDDYQTINIYIYYEEKVEGLPDAGKQFYCNLNESYKFEFSMTNGSNILGEWMTATYSVLQIYSGETDLIWRYHACESIGKSNITLVASNNASSDFTWFELTVQHAVNSIYAHPVKEIVETSEAMVLNVKVQPGASLPMGNLMVTITYHTGDNETKQLLVTNETEFTKAFTVQGFYEAQALVSSESSNMTLNVPYAVWDKLAVTFEPKKAAAKVGELVEFEFLTPPASGFQYILDFGNTITVQNSDDVLNSTFIQPLLNTTYNEPIIYLISSVAFNPVYSFNHTTNITIQYPVENITMTPTSLVVPIKNSTVFFTIKMDQDLPMPTEAVCSINFADGTTESLDLNITYTSPLLFIHKYEMEGDFNVTIICSNLVSNVQLNAFIGVRNYTIDDFILIHRSPFPTNFSEPKAVELRIVLKDIQIPPPFINVEWNYGDGVNETELFTNWIKIHEFPNRGIFNGKLTIQMGGKTRDVIFTQQLGTIILDSDTKLTLATKPVQYTFQALSPGQESLTYSLFFDDGKNTTTNSSYVTHHYDYGGFYIPYVKAVNSTFSEYTSIDKAVVIENPLTTLVESYPANISHPPGKIVMSLTLPQGDREITFVTCTYNFGDSIDKAIYNKTDNVTDSSPIEYTYYYPTLGSHKVEYTCANQLTNTSGSFEVFVLNNCFTENGIFDRQYSQETNPMRIYTSKLTQITNRLLIKCINDGPLYRWDMVEVNATTNIKTVVDIVQPKKDFIQFQKSSIPVGIFCLSLNISFQARSDNWFSEITFLEFRDPPIRAEIVGGNQKTVSMDLASIIDGEKLSYDPLKDFGVLDEDLIFTWECAFVNSSTVKELLDLYMSSSEPIACSNITYEYSFGVLKFRDNIASSPTGYVFNLIVSKLGRLNGEFTQVIQVLKGAPVINIICQINCEIKTAVTSQLSLVSKCETCEEYEYAKAKYTWTLIRATDGVNETMSLNDLVEHTGENPSSIVLKKGILSPGFKYIMDLQVDIEGRISPGFASFQIHANLPPYNGTCYVNPISGVASVTMFKIYCESFMDEGFREIREPLQDKIEPLSYKYFIRKGNKTLPLDDGAESTSAELDVPVLPGDGDYQFVVLIFDILQDSTEYVMDVNITSPVSDIEQDTTASEVTGLVQRNKRQLEETDLTGSTVKYARALNSVVSVVQSIKLPDNTLLFEKVANDTGPDWNTIYNDFITPKDTRAASAMSKVGNDAMKTLLKRRLDVDDLNGQGVTQLSETVINIIKNPESTSLETAALGSEMAASTAQRLGKINERRPYPVSDQLFEAINSMADMTGSILDNVVPDLRGKSPVVSKENVLQEVEESGIGGESISREEAAFLAYKIAEQESVVIEKKKETSKNIMKNVEISLESSQDTLSSLLVTGQSAKTLVKSNIALSARKLNPKELAEADLEVEGITVNVPTANETGLSTSEAVTVQTTVLKTNPYTWGKNDTSYDIQSSVVKTKIRTENGTVLNIPLRLKLKTDVKKPFNMVNASDSLKGEAGMHLHKFILRKVTDSAIAHLILSEGTNVIVYMRINKVPTAKRYDFKTIANSTQFRGQNVFKVVAPANTFKETGVIVMGVLIHEGEAPSDADISGQPRSKRSVQTLNSTVLNNHTNNTANDTSSGTNGNVDSSQYGVLLTTDGCRVWNDEEEVWDPRACKVSPYSSPDETICVCDDPPGNSFASAFYVSPNTIDFSLIWSKFDISNASVYGTLIGVLVLYVIVVIWARINDEKDKDRWRVGYLNDNLAEDKCFYLITVHTGLRKNAGTQSSISFIMAGEHGDTGARCLSDGRRSFETGSVMNLICSTQRDLGDLSYFRVWHDNTGRGSSASWFLSKIIVQDLQNQKRYIFSNNRWLGVDKDDGMVDRLIPLTDQDDLMSFDKLFSSHARLNLTDSHLWLSVFLRPDKSSFSRVQRVSCCLALLFLTMIVSAMFFKSENETTDEETVKNEFQIGIIRLSMSAIFTSFVSVIITVPPTLFLVFLFKSSKPSKDYFKVKPKSRCFPCCLKTKPDEHIAISGEEIMENTNEDKKLPHYCIYIAWSFVFIIVSICSFFLILYSMEWGKSISEEWMTSFFLSFAENIFVLDPMKVLLLSVLLAFCMRSPYSNSDKVNISKVRTEAKKFGLNEVDLSQLPPDPIPESLLQKAKERRKQEMRAQTVFLDLILYAVFLFGLYCICYGNRDTQSFTFHSHVEKAVFTDGFDQIKSYDDFFKWVEEQFIPSLFPIVDFSGKPLNWRRKLFFDDHVNFRVGPARFRQVRTVQRTAPYYCRNCRKLTEGYTYFWPYSALREETTSFCPSWTAMPCTLNQTLSSSTIDAWKYSTSEENWGSPIPGTLDIYGGGGYVFDMSLNKDISIQMFQEIKQNIWLDRQTRAVFVEFSLYNANNNLLTVIRLIAEFPEFGSVITGKQMSTMRLFQNVGPIGAFIILCEIIVVIILFVFAYKCIKRLVQQKLNFFKSFWNIIDFINIILTLTVVIFFILREVYSSKTLNRFRENPKKFVNFEHIVLWDSFFVYALSLLVFTATIGMLKILGYNKRFTMIGEVLRASAKDLLGFSSVFLIFFSAYIITGYVLFATRLYNFRTPWDAANTIFIYLLGKNQLGQQLERSDELGIFYFFTLVFFVIFILLTMFQVIMNNSMTMVRSDVMSIPAPYGIVDVLLGIYRGFVSDWIPSSFLSKKDEFVVREMENRRQRSQVHNILQSFKEQFEKNMDVKGASAQDRKGFFNFDNLRNEPRRNHLYP